MEDEDDMYDPLLDDLDLETLMENEDCRIGGAEEDPAHKTQEDVVTWEKPGIPGGERDGDRSHHERSASIITTGATCATPNAYDQQPGTSRDTTYSTPIVRDEDSSEKQDQANVNQDERMDIHSVDDDVIHAGQGSPKEKLQTLLEHKAHLRQVLLRAEHHHVFLDKCKTGNIIPKGLRLNREIHFMRGNETCQTACKIEDLLSLTETNLRALFLKHDDDLIASLNSAVQVTERKIQTATSKKQLSQRDKRRILSNFRQSEVEENKLRVTLEQTRQDKFRSLTYNRKSKDRRSYRSKRPQPYETSRKTR